MFDHPSLIAKVLLEGSAPRATIAPFEVPARTVRRRAAKVATA